MGKGASVETRAVGTPATANLDVIRQTVLPIIDAALAQRVLQEMERIAQT